MNSWMETLPNFSQKCAKVCYHTAKEYLGKQREAASHVFSFMISEEQRNIKPYAIPVRFLTYSSITDKTVRDLKRQLVDEMRKLDMLSVGMYCTYLIPSI